MTPVKGDRRRRPHLTPDVELFIENLAASMKVHAQGGVFVAVPAHRWEYDQSTVAQEIERAEILRRDERMSKRRDNCAQDQAQ
jgi:hypothetical protein